MVFDEGYVGWWPLGGSNVEISRHCAWLLQILMVTNFHVLRLSFCVYISNQSASCSLWAIWKVGVGIWVSEYQVWNILGATSREILGQPRIKRRPASSTASYCNKILHNSLDKFPRWWVPVWRPTLHKIKYFPTFIWKFWKPNLTRCGCPNLWPGMTDPQVS